ncbi:MAG: tetratricopeptide repeat protein [Pseudomonadota bacterium]
MRGVLKAIAVISATFLSACSTDISRLDQGVAMLADRQYAEAQTHFEAMLAEDAGDPYVNLNLGVASANLGDKVAAARYYRTAIANGQSARIETTVQGGEQSQQSTTVAALAARNLELLGS